MNFYGWKIKVGFNSSCSNDTYFYQACDRRLHHYHPYYYYLMETNNQTLCGSFQCQFNNLWGKDGVSLNSVWLNLYRSLYGNYGFQGCKNTDYYKGYCKTEDDCGDKRRFQGLFCDKTVNETVIPYQYVYPEMICDGKNDCDNLEDEENCTKSNEKDVHVICNSNQYLSSSSKSEFCYAVMYHRNNLNITLCEDKIEKNCEKAENCYYKLHKHFFCDGEIDCENGSDETATICQAQTIETCKVRVGDATQRTIPLSWLRDGVQDCVDGSDEYRLQNWSSCGRGKTWRFQSGDKACENVYICQSGEPGFVELGELCDGIETCGNENEVCSVSRNKEKLETNVLSFDNSLTKKISFCVEGLRDSLNQSHNLPCTTDHFIFPDHEFYGVETKTKLILPKRQEDCEHMFGEQYVYTSCTGKCSNSSCPLKTIPSYEVCPSQFSKRVGTLANNKYLAFFTVARGNIFTNRYFVCEDKQVCLEYSQVCDLVRDCDDGSDEEYCSNHFECQSSGSYIPKTSVCDGVFDCRDFSDECNEKCSKQILQGDILKVFAWLIGVVSVLANMMVLLRQAIGLKTSRNAVVLINKSLIILISFGDLLIGCYLIVITVYDNLVFQNYSYCHKQIEWITSTECSIIGVFSTIGSQISLFSMTGLSIVRIYVIWTSRSRNKSGQFCMTGAIVAIGIVILVTVASVAIAVLPIVRRYEDFFVNGVNFSEKLRIFIGTTNKRTVLNILGAYHGRMTRKTIPSWERILEMVGEMFSHDFDYHDFANKSTAEKVHFYGNDGVCLFKYFVDEDPQKVYVWSILAINFSCFLFISVSYLLIYLITSRSSNATGNQNESNRMKSMNRKIAFIITTDFCCWIPFIVVCCLHSIEVVDATQWYGLFSMIILPINSMINPFLYDDFMIRSVRKKVGGVSNFLTNFSAISTNRNPANETSVQADGIEMQPVEIYK